MSEVYERTVHITDLSGSYPQTEQYLSLIRESDAAFEELITYFSQREPSTYLYVWRSSAFC